MIHYVDIHKKFNEFLMDIYSNPNVFLEGFLVSDKKKSLYQTAMESVGGDSRLQVRNEVEDNGETAIRKRVVRTKTLKAIPASYFDAHRTLRDNNKTILDFSNYIMEALREKLERDGAL